jgi:hypothetical protein
MMKLTAKREAFANAMRDKGVPAEWAILIAERCDGFDSNIRYALGNLSEVVACVFLWSNTPEGTEFWSSVDTAFIEEVRSMR